MTGHDSGGFYFWQAFAQYKFKSGLAADQTGLFPTLVVQTLRCNANTL